MNRAKPEPSLEENINDFYSFPERNEWGFVDLVDVEVEAPLKFSTEQQESYQCILRKEISKIEEKILTTHASKVNIIKDLMTLKQSLLLELEVLSSPPEENSKICSHCYNQSVFFETSEPYLRCNICTMPVVKCSSCEVAMAKYFCSLKGACDVCLGVIPSWQDAPSYVSFRDMDFLTRSNSPSKKFSKGIEDIDLGTLEVTRSSN